ncbi:MAG: trypsin-like peptidase domain-containing protein [Thermoguttaceae bacterium]|nr:trypsin-like peptidase domain-containing protein [Thermoguttaceae bacterium]
MKTNNTIIAVLFAILTFAVCAPGMSDDDAAAVNQAKGLSKAFRAATKKALPAVVQIKNSDNIEMPAIGSGVIIEPSGIVLTNNHVTVDEKVLYVQLTDGRIYKVVQTRTDPYTDLAVLQIKPEEKLPFAKLGDSDLMDIGDWVLAIGAPFSLDQSVSAGIISAKDRSIEEMPRTTMIQTDAAINPGNSGGPLINLDGEVIGITSAIYTTKGSYEGVSFAIPSNTARWASNELLKYGKVRRSYLGVGTSPVPPQTIRAMGIPIRPAVRISRFFANSPAEKSGLRIGDIILEFNGQPVKTAADIQRLVEQTPAGAVGKITIYRKGGQPSPLMMVQVKVASMPEDFIKRANSEFNGEDIQVFQSEELGFSAIDLHQQLAGQINLNPNTGIYIMDVSQNSPAMHAGLRKGIVIQACNGIKTWTVNEFVAALERADLNRGVMLTILVNGRPTSVLLRR